MRKSLVYSIINTGMETVTVGNEKAYLRITTFSVDKNVCDKVTSQVATRTLHTTTSGLYFWNSAVLQIAIC